MYMTLTALDYDGFEKLLIQCIPNRLLAVKQKQTYYCNNRNCLGFISHQKLVFSLPKYNLSSCVTRDLTLCKYSTAFLTIQLKGVRQSVSVDEIQQVTVQFTASERNSPRPCLSKDV